MDCRQPIEAAYLPKTPTNALVVSDYREELIKVLSLARQCAAECIQNAQRKYKTQYDKRAKTSPNQYKIGDWVLIKHPQDETGANRKLSRPWYGPFRITRLESTGIIAEQIYGNSPKDQIRVHLQRVTKCPPAFPAGYYWYGGRHNGPGRPPKWVDRFVNETVFEGGERQDNRGQTSSPHDDQQDEQVTNLQLDQDNIVMDQNEDDQGADQRDVDKLTKTVKNVDQQTTGYQITDVDDKTEPLLVPRTTRTRIVKPPVHYSS